MSLSRKLSVCCPIALSPEAFAGKRGACRHTGQLGVHDILVHGAKTGKGGEAAVGSCDNALADAGLSAADIDEVLLVGTPPSITSTTQRIGRAGHGVGQTSFAKLYPVHAHDIVRASVVVRAMLDGEVEPLKPVTAPLDVLAQRATLASLEDEGYFRESCAKVIASRERLAAALAGLGFEVFPSSANFVFVRHPEYAARNQAVCILTDVHHGMQGVEPGEVQWLRINEALPRYWDTGRRWGTSLSSSSWKAALWPRVQWGVVPVEEDGSAHFLVPAGRSIFYQALDENFMEVQRERTYVNYRPGEQRSCIGCHEQPNSLPVAQRSATAMAREPSRSTMMSGPAPIR